MSKSSDVLKMLIPQGGWLTTGDDYEGITFLECEPITKAQFTAGLAKLDAWKAEQDTKAAADKASAQAKLEALGLTANDLKALGL